MAETEEEKARPEAAEKEAGMKLAELTLILYLHPSENPGIHISTVKLVEKNYQEWERAMRMALRAKRKLALVDGSVREKDIPQAKWGDWLTANFMVVSWITNAVDDSPKKHVCRTEVAYELWEDLKIRFSVGNGPMKYQLKCDIVNCKQRGQSVLLYYNRLKSMWDDLDAQEPPLVCTCVASKEMVRRQDEDRLHQFLTLVKNTPLYNAQD